MEKYCVTVKLFDFVEAETEDEAFAKATDDLYEDFHDVDYEVSEVFQIKK